MVARIAGLAETKRTPARIAPRKCSGGRLFAGACRFQAMRASISTRKHSAFSAKAASTPARPMAKPPMAGPTVRDRLKPIPFSAMACTRSSRGTSSGVVAAQAGKFSALPMPMQKVSTSSPQGPTPPRKASSASSAATQSTQACAAMR